MRQASDLPFIDAREVQSSHHSNGSSNLSERRTENRSENPSEKKIERESIANADSFTEEDTVSAGKNPSNADDTISEQIEDINRKARKERLDKILNALEEKLEPSEIKELMDQMAQEQV